jgi:hypothetical protein
MFRQIPEIAVTVRTLIDRADSRRRRVNGACPPDLSIDLATDGIPRLNEPTTQVERR